LGTLKMDIRRVFRPVVLVAVDAEGRDQAGEPLQQLERREQERGLALDVGLGQVVEEPRVG
jgi:hypothetical protein